MLCPRLPECSLSRPRVFQEYQGSGAAPPAVGGAAPDPDMPQIAGPGASEEEMKAAADRFREARAEKIAGVPPRTPREGGGAPSIPDGGAQEMSPQVAKTADEEEMDELAEMMRMRKPKNFGDGLLSGMGNVAKGVGAGLGAAVALPVAGAVQEGPKGFFKGLGAGLAAAVAAPVAGVVAGGVQISRGVTAGAEAREAEAKGMVWDEKLECWVERVPWLLENEAAKVSKTDEFCMKNEKFCIKNEEFLHSK